MIIRTLLVCLFCILPSFAFQDFDTFYEKLDVVLYQLQVNVVDKKGNPIRGLTKEDFQIRIANKSQEIEAIEEIALEEMMAQASTGIPEQAKRIFVFFFDLRYSKKGGIIAANRAAKEFVQTELLPSDLVGIFTYSPLRGITMVSNFTSDQNHLLKALGTLGLGDTKHTLPGPSGYFLDGLLQDLTAELASGSGQGGQSFSPEQAASQAALSEQLDTIKKIQLMEKRNYENEVQSYISNFNAFAEGLKYIRGRKNILWFSSGFDSSGLIGEDLNTLAENAEEALYGDMGKISPDQLGRGDLLNIAEQTIKALQGSGSVIFAIDTSRLDGFANKKSGLQALNFFSVDTGGRTFTNQNNLLPVMEEIQTLTNHYYLLSFHPKSKGKPGKVESLKVKVKASGARVFASKGILLNPDFKGMNTLEKQIHLAEFIGRDQVVSAIPMNINSIQVPMNDTLVKLSLTTDILGDYFLDTHVKNKPKQMELYTFAFTKKTNEIFDQASFQFRIEPQEAKEVLKETGVKYIADLFLEPGDYKLKVIARDMDTGKIGSAIVDVEVKATDFKLSGPTLLDSGKWIMLREREEHQAQKKSGNLDFTYVYSFKGRNLVPDTKAEVRSDQVASFFYTLANSQGQNPKIGAALMGPDKKPIPIPAEALSVDYDIATEGQKPNKVLLSVDLSKLSLNPGEIYKMLAQFQVGDDQPIRSISNITVLPK